MRLVHHCIHLSNEQVNLNGSGFDDAQVLWCDAVIKCLPNQIEETRSQVPNAKRFKLTFLKYAHRSKGCEEIWTHFEIHFFFYQFPIKFIQLTFKFELNQFRILFDFRSCVFVLCRMY